MSTKTRILLLEDDPNLGLIIQESLMRHNFDVQLCRDGIEGLEAHGKRAFDLCLVDVMMPRMDGFEFAREIRKRDAALPLVFLTAKELAEDKIEGFKIGCDDYVTKPFSMEELLLRLQAILRRLGNATDQATLPERLTIGCYIFDRSSRSLEYLETSRSLTDRECDLLELLCQNLNQTLDRSVALQKIWGDDGYHCGRSMDVFISRLRKYLKDDPLVEIRTVHGRGFQLRVASTPS